MMAQMVERRGRGSGAELIVELTDLALAAADVPTAVAPILDQLVASTAAVGSAYFQADPDGDLYFARAASGEMPDGPGMEAILAHGLPEGTPLFQALSQAWGPLLFDDAASASAAAGFPELGVASLAAVPVRDARRRLLGGFLLHTFDRHDWTPFEANLLASVAGTLAGLTARLVAEERALAAQEQAVRALGLALETRDRETRGHTDRVAALALRIGEALELADDDLRALRWGAYLHDVGKIGVPDAILLKPGRLDTEEWALMRNHPQFGYAFGQMLGFLPPKTLEVVRHHHERWDGNGYPDGLAGEAIPALARIFAVADVYDALLSERPYKAAWSRQEAVDEIRRQVGYQLDPAVVAAFLDLDGIVPPAGDPT